MRPLEGVTVIDAATLFAGPLAATMLGDFGAEVLKIEHPTKGDPARTHGPSKDGVGLWWTLLGRNKQTVALDLSARAGADVLLRLAATADVLIENFRPGTLERWGVGPEQLHAVNPRLVIARVTGFGQKGPYASRPASAPSPSRCPGSHRSPVSPTVRPRSPRSASPTASRR